MRCKYFALVLPLAVFACNPGEIDDFPCPDTGTALTYDNFGQPFLSTHCQSCHGGLGSDRRGAPLAYDFGSPELARNFKDRIFIRAAWVNTTMPPGPDDPSEKERQDLAEWLACDAP